VYSTLLQDTLRTYSQSMINCRTLETQ